MECNTKQFVLSMLGVVRLLMGVYTFAMFLYTQVSNRRSRKWFNDRLLIELVPRLYVEEIKGLFAPPPWGKHQMPLWFTECDFTNLAIIFAVVPTSF
jgi:hypothetical protein